jgi:hypothetical protein
MNNSRYTEGDFPFKKSKREELQRYYFFSMVTDKMRIYVSYIHQENRFQLTSILTKNIISC